MTFIIGTPFARGAGYFHNVGVAMDKQQDDVRTCPHCQAVILLNQWRKVENGSLNGGFCMRCNAPVCHHCNKRMQTEGCDPFMAKVERGLRADQKLKVFQKLAGLDPPEPQQALLLPGSGA